MPGIRDHSERGIPRAGGSESRDFEVPDCEQDNPYDQPPRLDLARAGYEWDCSSRKWSKLLVSKTRRARVDHKDGTVCAGDTYWELVGRSICDETSEQRMWRVKQIITKCVVQS